MATTDPSSAMRGPRYAPDDPTLPEPWKPLIDGSTGHLYYWNPETNVTQYERPASLNPVLQSGELHTGNASTLKDFPEALPQSESIQTMPYQQRVQSQLSHGQAVNSSSQPQTQVAQWASQQAGPTRQLHGQHLVASTRPVLTDSEQYRLEMTQHSAHQLSSQVGKIPLQHGPPVTQNPTQQVQHAHQQPMHMPHVQHRPVSQAASPGTPLGYQYMPQPTHMLHQKSTSLQGPQSSLQQSQYLFQGQQLPPELENKTVSGVKNDLKHQGGSDFSSAPQHQFQGRQFNHDRDMKAAVSGRDGVDFQQMKKPEISPNHIQQTGSSSLNTMFSGPYSSHAQDRSLLSNQNAPHGVPSINMQHKNLSAPAHHGSDEVIHQEHGSSFQNRMVKGLLHGQLQNVTHGGPKLPYEENNLGRSTNDFFVNNSRDVNALPPQLPRLAPLPIPRNQPEVRSSGFSSQSVMPTIQGRLSDPAGLPINDAFRQPSSAHQYPDNTFMRPPFPIVGPSDSVDLSAAEAYRRKHEVKLMGDNVPAPFMTFEAAGLPPEILQEIRIAGFSAPTPIQAQTWPIALQNRDIVAIAKTGSGKTLGYLIPALIHLRRRHNNPQFGPTVLVLAPTRELATQIQDEAIKFGQSSRASCTCLYGGAPKGPQLRELERGAEIIVATPGRLNDILEMKKIDFRQVSFLVLDEADRMLDMGFEPQIRKIVNAIPPRRQTLMYTATWPKDVVKIASDLLVNPVQVNIGSVDELEANKSITQYIEVVPEMEKQRRLEQILRSQERGSKVIIFCSTKKLCDQLARSIGRLFGALAIHGDKSQGERDWVLNQFRSGKSQVLVATDVAARGLDIRDIRVVINYDFPTGIEDYVHRIGRTGRAGATGMAYTFFSEQDWKHAPDLVKVLEGANQVVPPEIRDIASRGGPNFSRDRVAINRYGSTDGAGRWNATDHIDTRDSGFGGRVGMREGAFGGRGPSDGNFRGRGGDGPFGGRGGMRDGGFNGRDGNFGGRGGGRDGNFFTPSGSRGGWDRGGRGATHERFNMDVRGHGRSRGRGRFDGRRDSRDRSISPRTEGVRTWGYNRSRSRSRSSSLSRRRRRSYSRSRSRSRSWSRSRSPRSPSRSPSYERRPPRKSKFDQMAPDTAAPDAQAQHPYASTGPNDPQLPFNP